MREGNNILGVDFCARSQPEYVRYLYDNANPGGNILISSSSFTVCMKLSASDSDCPNQHSIFQSGRPCSSPWHGTLCAQFLAEHSPL